MVFLAGLCYDSGREEVTSWRTDKGAPRSTARSAAASTPPPAPSPSCGMPYRSFSALRCPPSERRETGKPYFPDRPDICFSLSHTKTHLLAAVSGRPVGADIETRRPVRPGVAERVCAPEELGAFDFFELWVLKESFVKVTGETRVNPRNVRFGRAGGALVTPDPGIRARLFDAIPGCAAAVCVMGGPLPRRARDSRPGRASGFPPRPEIAGRADRPHTMTIPEIKKTVTRRMPKFKQYDTDALYFSERLRSRMGNIESFPCIVVEAPTPAKACPRSMPSSNSSGRRSSACRSRSRPTSPAR